MFLILFLSVFDLMNGKIDSLRNPKDEPNDHPRVFRNELLRLNNLAKPWDYPCSFCFKTFPSAQALGGHQNAHKNQRREREREATRPFMKDHINYGKRAFTESRKSVDVAAAPNDPKHAKFYREDLDEGSPGTACMAVNRKKQGSSSFSEFLGNTESILPVPIPKGKTKAEELDLTLKL